jgi:3-phenylpropionate/cinnamic acid dioxygenase small subunit
MRSSDVINIQNAIYEYCHFLDDEQFEDLGNLLSDCDLYVDGKLVSAKDRASVATRFSAAADRARASGRTKIRHIVGNVIVNGNEGEANARSTCVVIETHGSSAKLAMTASYADRFVCGPTGWRFSERRIVVDNRS